MSELPELPDLPDLAAIKAAAYQHRDHYARIVKDAQAEVAKADAILKQLGGRANATPSRIRRRASDSAYLQILIALGNHNYAGVTTLSGSSGFSASQCHLAMERAVHDGRALREKRGRKVRWKITEAGMEFLTRSSKAVI